MKSIRKLSFHERVLKQARIFLLRGFFVLPIPPRKKAPRTKNWTELHLEIRDLRDAFGREDNIGVLLGAPSGGLTDVDLDSAEAIALAHLFLPPTDRISARASKPESHRWYLVKASTDNRVAKRRLLPLSSYNSMN